MNCISGGRARWEVIRQEGIKTYIARIIEKRDITKKCRVFKDHLEQLVKSGHLKEFVVVPKGNAVGQASRTQGSTLPLPLGVIEVIFCSFNEHKPEPTQGGFKCSLGREFLG